MSGNKICYCGPRSKGRAKTPLTSVLWGVKRLTCAMWFCSQANYPLLFLSSFLTFPVRHEPNCHSADSEVHAEEVLFPRRKLQFADTQSFVKTYKRFTGALSAGVAREVTIWQSPLTASGQQREKHYTCWPEVGSADMSVAITSGWMDGWMDGRS